LKIAAILCDGATVFAAKPAKAADLGGDCCTDLEERVADLEANGAQGQQRSRCRFCGKVNYAVMFWDDGGEQNARRQ
jgi:hypothetical protein